jgi:hypothetical protein
VEPADDCLVPLPDEASDQAARSRELGAEDDFATQTAWRLAQARVLSHRGIHDEAVALTEDAVAIMEPTDYLAWQAEGDEVHGIVLAAASRDMEARDAFARAIERFERKGVIPSVERVRNRLTGLDGR